MKREKFEVNGHDDIGVIASQITRAIIDNIKQGLEVIIFVEGYKKNR